MKPKQSEGSAMFYIVYNLLSLILLPLLLIFTIFRAVRLRWPLALGARFGLIPASELAKIRGRQVILVHAVSVGEVITARILVRALRERYPDHALVVSSGTETGRQTALGFAEVDLCVYLPFDLIPSVRLMLSSLSPELIIIMETEIWPNFMKAAEDSGVPVLLANGRISDRSFGRYQKLSWFFRQPLQKFTRLCMQSDLTRERIITIGAPASRVTVAGNLKLDIASREISITERDDLRNSYRLSQDCLVLIAGSTHAGEESMLLSIYRQLLAEGCNLLMVLAPRHPQRSDEVAGLIEMAGISFRRLTGLTGPGDALLQKGELLLVDTVGELMNLYALADVGFVGGSLVPKGGHNLLEPASLGLPSIFGSYMANFREIAALVKDCEAGIQVASAGQLAAELKRLLQDPAERQRLGRNGLEMIRSNGGATARHMEIIETVFNG